MSKLSRQNAIRELLGAASVSSQDELRRSLLHRGFRVTQATLSRDIHELGLIKTSEGYTLPGNGSRPPASAVERLIREFVREIRRAQNLIILKTPPGSAQTVAAALDSANWKELVGTVAGDDTILIISPDKNYAEALADRITEMVA